MADEFRAGMYKCPECEGNYYRDQPWKAVCLECYLERKGTTRKAAPPRPEQPIEPQAPAIPQDMLRRLIQLAHPDRHGNSEAANIATRYLLELRKGTA